MRTEFAIAIVVVLLIAALSLAQSMTFNAGNIANITVILGQPPVQPPTGGAAPQGSVCLMNWTCAQWSPCLPEGVSLRICTDSNDCEEMFANHQYGEVKGDPMPETSQSCQYITSCYNGYADVDETDADCGGVCGPCDSGRHCADDGDCKVGVCYNYVCTPESTCFDDIQDAGEEGIDCGGPCVPCPAFPIEIPLPTYYYIWIIAAAVGLIGLWLLFLAYKRKTKKQRKRKRGRKAD